MAVLSQEHILSSWPLVIGDKWTRSRKSQHPHGFSCWSVGWRGIGHLHLKFWMVTRNPKKLPQNWAWVPRHRRTVQIPRWIFCEGGSDRATSERGDRLGDAGGAALAFTVAGNCHVFKDDVVVSCFLLPSWLLARIFWFRFSTVPAHSNLYCNMHLASW